MPFDQNITYKVNIDDSNFQAKLTQMRASLDSAGGGGGFGRTMAYMGPMGGGGNFGNVGMGGMFSDFGSQIQPVTFTPPAIAMQPHFGMFQIQQNLSQAGLAAAFGPAGINFGQMKTYGLTGGRDFVPPNMSYSEYSAYSTRALGDKASGVAAAVGGAALNLGANAVGGMAGAGISSMMGLGFLGGTALSLGIGAAVAAPVGAVVDRTADTLAIQNALSAGSFRFYQGGNADPITGRGFNRTDRGNIANSIMKMESNDGRFNTTDYRQILEGGMQMDLFSGTRDAEDFKGKFKSLVETVKTVSSTLHTSLKEGLETIRGLRDMGVSDPGMQQQMVLRSETLGRASGRTGMEMMAAGQTGAEMFRGTGISMQRGFELNQQNTTMVRQMLNTGNISRETIAQAGGENSLAQQMTANALGSFQTTQGRGFMMAAFDPNTMSLDQNMIGKIAGGDTMSGMARAAGVMSSPGNMIRFQAHQAEMISKLTPMQMQLFDVAQGAASAHMMMRGGMTGDASFEDVYTAMQLRAGKSHEVISAQMGMLKMDPRQMKQQLMQQTQAMADQQSGENFRNIAGYKTIGNFFTRTMIQPLSEGLSNMATSVGNDTERLFGDVRRFFTNEVDPRAMNSGMLARAQDEAQDRVNEGVSRRAREYTAKNGQGPSKEALLQMAQEESGKVMGGGRVLDISDGVIASVFGGGARGTLMKGVTGKESVGSTTTVDGVKMTVFESREAMEKAASASGTSYSNLGEKNGKYYGVSAKDQGDTADFIRRSQVDKDDVEKARHKMQKNKVSLDMNAVVKGGNDFLSLASVALKRSVTKENMKDLTKDELAMLRVHAEDNGLTEEYDSATSGSTSGRLSSQTSRRAAEDLEDVRKKMDRMANEAGTFSSTDLRERIKSDDPIARQVIQMVAAGADNDDIRAKMQSSRGGKKGASKTEVDKVLGDVLKFKSVSGGDNYLKKLSQNYQEQSSLALQVKEEATQMQKSEEQGASGVAGNMSKADWQNITSLAQAFEAQMRTLIQLQEKLKMGDKKGGLLGIF